MSLEDPFLIVQNEVFDALVKLKNNYNTWVNFNENSAATNEVTKDEYNAFLSELKNGIKSLKWDLDELEESLENTDLKSNLDDNEIQKRRAFIKESRKSVEEINENITKTSSSTNIFKGKDFAINFGGSTNTLHFQQEGTKYTRLINAPDSNKDLPGNGLRSTYDDDEHKSPYAPDHSVIFDDVDNNINVISSRFSHLDRIKQILHITNERQMYGVGAGVVVLLIIIILMF